jgi:hypothetical protein
VTFGKNAVSRSSKDAFLTSKDELTTKQMIKLVDEALEGKTTLYKEEVSLRHFCQSKSQCNNVATL